MRAQAIGMVDPARWRGHLRLRYAGFSDSPSVALSTRGIQALMAGDLSFTEAVGTSAINGKIAGGNIALSMDW